MDLNIGMALFFLSKSVARDTKTIFSGLGADELLGGYGRHKTALKHNCFQSELEKDLKNL